MFVAITGFITLPAQDTVSPRGSIRNRADVTFDELFGGIFIKLVGRVKKCRKLSLGKAPTGPL